MKKIKLNKSFRKTVLKHGYGLDPAEQYCIYMEDEYEQQQSIVSAVMTMGLPALNDYHK